MAVKPTVDIVGLEKLRNLFFRFGIALEQNEGLLEELAQYSIFKIKKRTSAGKDVDNEDFIPYSKKYSLFRAEKGRPTNKVDLFFTGSMISSITSDISNNQVVLYFMNTSDSSNVKNPLKAYFLNEKRNFFALSENDVEGLKKIVEKFISDLIR